MIGQRIGSYDVVRFIGEGGMGTVFQGVDAMLDREVAIKALRPELASQENVAARFRSEAVTLARLNHPNVALLYSFLQEPNGHLYMVMEFVRGETLEDLLRRVGPLEPAQAVEVMAQILDGVGHAHEAGIIHRDLKPANAMLTETGRVKVMDFGIARALGSARMTRAGRLIGTLEYMAPEQVQGKEATPATDVYALGIVLYELLTGRVPFESQSDFTLMQAQIQEAPAPPRVFRPGMPDALEAVILKALEKDPAARFASADEFRDALLALDLPAAKPIVGHVGVLDATQPNQYKTAAGLAPTVVAGGAVGGATRVASPSETPQTAVSAAAGGSLMHTLKTSRPAQIVLATALGVVMILGLFFAISGGGTTEPSSPDDLADQPGLSEEPPAERTNPSESPDLVQRTAPAGTLNQPDSGPAFVTVADLVQEARGHAAAGRADAARAVVKRILSVDPDNTEALQIQRQLNGEPETASRETTTRPAQRRSQPERRQSSGTERTTPAPEPQRPTQRETAAEEKPAEEKPTERETTRETAREETKPAAPPANARSVQVRRGTALVLATSSALSSASLREGQQITFRVASAIRVDGATVIAAGATAFGRCRKARRGEGRTAGEMTIEVESVQTVDGQRLGVRRALFSDKAGRGENVTWPAGTRLEMQIGENATVRAG